MHTDAGGPKIEDTGIGVPDFTVVNIPEVSIGRCSTAHIRGKLYNLMFLHGY